MEKVLRTVSACPDTRVVLLRNEEVLKWLFSKQTFSSKSQEDTWGRAVMKSRRPDLGLEKQWTNLFGEYICEELLILSGKEVTRPPRRNHYKPDFEVDDAIWEAKTGTYYTIGSAGEKILGCPFKYSEVPDLYSKPLKILCVGGAEWACRNHYGNLDGERCSPQKKKFLEFFRESRIEFVGATDFLSNL